MSINEKFEEKIYRTDRKLKELSINLEKFNHEYQELLKELGLTPDELKSYTENPDNEIQNEMKKLDEKLNLEFDHIPNPLKTEKNRLEQRNIQPHWLFIR